VPGATDTAVFDLGSAYYTVTGDASIGGIAVATDGVTFDGQLTVGSGGLSATQGAYVTLDSNAFVDDAGTLAFDTGSTLEVDGTLITGGGTIDTALVTGFDGNWTDAATVTLNQLYVNSDASFAGNVDLTDGGGITLDTSATFGGGTLTLAGNGSVYVGAAVGDTAGTFGLSDAIVTSAAAGDGLSLAADAGTTVDVTGGITGTGYVYINSGDVILEGADDYSGGTVVDSAALTVVGGSAGTGAIFLQGASLETDADSTGAAAAETVVGGAGADTVTANAGALLVFGGDATGLTFQGGANTSVVVGGSGALVATGGAGGDLIFGGTSGADVLNSGIGPATLVGGSGGALTAIGSATDVLVAAAGNTTLNGATATGNDLYVTAGAGRTLVEAGSGVSTVVAGGASNVIFGSSGTQDVFLQNASGNELAFTHGEAGLTDVIGFTASDTILLAGYSSGEAQNAVANEVINSGNTILTLSDNTQIVLYGFTGLTTGNFT
jgi:hypothetical protein